MFNSYVKLPEGMYIVSPKKMRTICCDYFCVFSFSGGCFIVIYTSSSISACLMHLRVKTVRFASWMSWLWKPEPWWGSSGNWVLQKPMVEYKLNTNMINIVVEPMAFHFDPHALGISWLSRYLSYSHCCLCMFVLCIRFPIKSSSGLVHITRRLWASVCDKMWTCVGWSCDRCATWIHLASSRLKIEG